MSGNNGNLYSQGYNFASFFQNAVDPRTGQYTCTITVYDAPVLARNCPPLKLSLAFNPLNTQSAGFGKGWSLNLSSYRQTTTPNVAILVLSTGEHYRVSRLSGKLEVEDQKLINFHLLDSGEADGDILIAHKSGVVERLSDNQMQYGVKVPMAVYAVNGRRLTLSWQKHGSDAPRLTGIQQEGVSVLQIEYQDNAVRIKRTMDGGEPCTFTADISRDNRLQAFHLPSMQGTGVWEFGYEAADPEDRGNAMIVLSTLTSPLGQREEIKHQPKGHKLPSSGPYPYIPCVVQHTIRPASSQPSIKYLYSYSAENFLGGNAGITWHPEEDNLYHVQENYKYSTQVTIWTDSGRKTGEQESLTYTHNRFHLVTEVSRKKGANKVTQATTYWEKESLPFISQGPQFQLPRVVTTTYADNDRDRSETSEHTFDDWGNPLLEKQENGIQIERSYYDPKQDDDGCPKDPFGFKRYLKSESITAAPINEYPAPTRTKEYTYAKIATIEGSPADYFVAVKQCSYLDEGNAVTLTESNYASDPTKNDYGRLQQQTTTLQGQHPMTQNWVYQFDTPDEVTELTTITTFDGLEVGEETVVSAWTGLTLKHKDQTETPTQFQYDCIGRVLEVTLAANTDYEAKRLTEYNILPGYEGYTVTETDVEGVQTIKSLDGLGRIMTIQRQDADASPGATEDTGREFRVVEERKYNDCGQCIRVDTTDWLRTTADPTSQCTSKEFEYDNWGQTCQIIESNGVIRRIVADPISLTQREYIEGGGVTQTKMNLFGHPDERCLIDKNNTTYSTMKYYYDGLGRLAEEEDQLGHRTRYEFDVFDRVVRTTGPTGRTLLTQYTDQSLSCLPISVQVNQTTLGAQSVDGLLRVTERTIGGRTTRQTFDGICPKPLRVTKPDDQQSEFTYDHALDYEVTSIQREGNTSQFDYDKQTASILSADDDFSKRSLKYFPSQLVAEDTVQVDKEPELTAHSTYSMGGKLQRYDDIFGGRHEISYDSNGRQASLTKGNIEVRLEYTSSTNLLSEGVVEVTDGQLSLKTSIAYDEFDREVERTVSKGSDTLCKLTQSYGPTGLVNTRERTSADGSLLQNESFEYDEQNRLTKYRCQGSQAPVDQYGHPIQTQQFDFDALDNLTQVTTMFQDNSVNTATYQYASNDPTQLTQITNTHAAYPKQIDLAYDENGSLTRDEKGRTLQYDSLDRLRAVIDPDNRPVCQYHYDVAGRLVCQEVPGQATTYLYYRGENTLIATTSGNQRVTYINAGGTYWGQEVEEGDKDPEYQLWASNAQTSVLTYCNSGDPSTAHEQPYTPYGFSETGSSIGLHGQWHDPITGWYHLGQGYRVYNPVLMRFHTPDRWSPFVSGEINPYAYCLGDPINRTDPGGHTSLLKSLVVFIVGLIVGAIADLLTGGALTAIEAGVYVQLGVSVAGSVVSDTVTPALYDLASGQGHSWGQVAQDAVQSVVANALTAGFSIAGLKPGLKDVFKQVKSTVQNIDGESGRFVSYIGSTSASNGLGSEIKSAERAAVNTIERTVANESRSSLAHGELGVHGQASIGKEVAAESTSSKLSSVAKSTIKPAIRDGEKASSSLSASPLVRWPLTKGIAWVSGWSSRQGVAFAMNSDGQCAYQEVKPAYNVKPSTVYSALQTQGGVQRLYPSARSNVRQDNSRPMNWQAVRNR
ncbi:RHS repeat domain-containing protein [Aspergillus saccharolyticus JOP 1030-1]|uniref:RHS repeat protein n=1 Tax=Aspergillus saccharolyticus JOP 1030-1 TaxID=1450539 RepID=A0A318YYJ6_9EURO|nr:RHS repeat protein [Aspergillus saccharolyticus JOP 1030-1]PYH40071.1 RHS repeat protein [Aspergillus saccharolyticus JOP 1030-1]